jgi:hypothetical protein
MKLVRYYGVKRSEVVLSATLHTALKQSEAHPDGILVPKGGRKAAILGWGDALICLKEALLVSPEMRSDLRNLLEECEAVAPTDPLDLPAKRATLRLICQERGLWGRDNIPQFLVLRQELLEVLDPLLPGISGWTERQALAYLVNQQEQKKEEKP